MDKITQYFNSLKDKKITILGIGVSHIPLIEKLAGLGVAVTACDKRERQALGETADRLEALGVTLRLGESYLENLSGDVIFKTPGMRFDLPELLAAVEKGSTLTTEMEVFFELCPCTVIAVTGSDGKTTTTSLIAEMLKKAGKTVHLGGNIGKPLLPEIEKITPADFAVVELSSFQLHTMKHSPHVAVMTNLAPNHLDMHKDMAEYVSAKENIYRYQNGKDVLVLNADNAITNGFAPNARGALRRFSFKMPLEKGVYYENGTVIDATGNAPVALLNRADIRLPGDHNVENYMAAICAVRDYVSDADILTVAREFAGVKHRIEFVRELSGVRFYNDSIASSPSRTLASIKAFDKKVHLLLGGYDKHIPFDILGEELPKYAKALYLSGATAPAIRKAVESTPDYDVKRLPIYEFESFALATRAAYENAETGDIVMLSPACASFDRFKNFEERGAYFIETVKELVEK